MTFLAYFLFSIITFIYNYKCYKKNIIVFTIRKRYELISEKKYCYMQFYFWNCIGIFLILIGVLSYFNKSRVMVPIYLVVSAIFFWGMNLFLEDRALKKNYIKIK